MSRLRIVCCVLLLAGLATLAAPPAALAVPNPRSIAWKASPNAFVASLYRGVLNRAPESRQAVAGWASHINHHSSSRLKVFWYFVGSQEYKRSVWAKHRRSYYLYRKSNQRDRKYAYYAAKMSPRGGQRIKGGPYTRSVAVALAGYYKAWFPHW